MVNWHLPTCRRLAKQYSDHNWMICRFSVLWIVATVSWVMSTGAQTFPRPCAAYASILAHRLCNVGMRVTSYIAAVLPGTCASATSWSTVLTPNSSCQRGSKTRRSSSSCQVGALSFPSAFQEKWPELAVALSSAQLNGPITNVLGAEQVTRGLRC